MKQKLKSKRGAAKRFKVTAKGKVKMSKANRRHLLTAKSTKHKRHSRGSHFLKGANAKAVKKMLLK